MASLREIKSKISSVKSTQQITSAMRMVSTVKLARAQRITENFRPYQQKVSQILTNFLSTQGSVTSLYEEQREVNKVAIVVFSGNMNLCGAFNSNVVKEFVKTTDQLAHLPKENIEIYAIGKKIAQAIKKMEFEPKMELDELANNPNYDETVEIADILENEKVTIVNNNNGERFETYVIEGEPGSGIVCLNGAAARLVQKGDIVIILTYTILEEEECVDYKPILVFVDENNQIQKVTK